MHRYEVVVTDDLGVGEVASAFSHVVVPLVLGRSFKEKVGWRLLVFGMILSIAPDADSIAFQFGIPYESPWGHRGFTHSIFFALVCAFLFSQIYEVFKSSRVVVVVFSFLSMVSHGFLDALTNGGLGVAFFWPVDSSRYFLPWQVIEVSPLSVSRFFTGRGFDVLKSEFLYIWLPGIILILANLVFKNWFYRKN